MTNENAYFDEDDYLLVYPERLKTTPSPGIIQNYGIGYSLMWIENDVLYVINNLQVFKPIGSEILLKYLTKL